MEAAAKRGRDANNVLCKPSADAFALALELAGASAASTIFFDDSVRNIVGAKRVGLKTVLLEHEGPPCEGADCHLKVITELQEIMPNLWPAGQQAEAPASAA